MSHSIMIKNLESNNTLQIASKPIRCPYCMNIIMPRYIGAVSAHDHTTLKIFMKCINPNCENIFLATYSIGSEEYNTYQELAVAEQKFDDSINDLSPSFVNIYNRHTRQNRLDLVRFVEWDTERHWNSL